MGVLVDWQIEQRCLQGMVVPYNPLLLNPASIDVRVGDTAKLLVYTEKGFVAWVKRKLWQYFEWGNEPKIEWLDIDLSETTASNPYWLKVGDHILIGSLETFNLGEDICAQFILKSSRGREFYEHLLSGFCDPEWNGSKLTMEVINHSLKRLPLYKGFRLGQMVFSKLDALPRKSYRVTGRYNGDKAVQESRG